MSEEEPMTTVAAHIGAGASAELEAFAKQLGVKPARSRQAGKPARAQQPANAARAPRTLECKTCRGRFTAADGTGRPFGWYSVSVTVPPELGKHGKPFLWLGTFCSARCLAAAMPAIAAAEAQPHGYQPDRPQCRAPDNGVAALMREIPKRR
jgi:hypothetical protein